LAPYPGPRVAIIIEERCIGCARCLPACPVDAIVGASKWMHTVIADHCTGCELCIAPCPVDCIEMVPSSTDVREPTRANLSRQRTRAHARRAETRAAEAERRRRERRNTRGRTNATS
jgi:electron transport complex protein RnfB